MEGKKWPKVCNLLKHFYVSVEYHCPRCRLELCIHRFWPRERRVQGGITGGFVGSGWLVEAADLAHILQRCRADFFVVHGWLESEQGLDVSTHMLLSLAVGLIVHVEVIYLSVVTSAALRQCPTAAYGMDSGI